MVKIKKKQNRFNYVTKTHHVKPSIYQHKKKFEN